MIDLHYMTIKRTLVKICTMHFYFPFQLFSTTLTSDCFKIKLLKYHDQLFNPLPPPPPTLHNRIKVSSYWYTYQFNKQAIFFFFFLLTNNSFKWFHIHFVLQTSTHITTWSPRVSSGTPSCQCFITSIVLYFFIDLFNY